MIKDYFIKEWKALLKAFFAGLLVAGACLVYIRYVGEPITTARNKFNEGIRLMEQGFYKDAYSKFLESDNIWWTAETAAKAEEAYQLSR